MSNWFEAEDGILLNLDHVKGIVRDGAATTLYVELSDELQQITTMVPYEIIKQIVQSRAASGDMSEKFDQLIKHNRTLALSAYTPTP